MSGKTGKSEKQFDSEFALAYNKGGSRLFRNIVATLWTNKSVHGHQIKVGVGGKGGSDRIGFQQIKITPEMVGKTVAIFAAAELKTDIGVVSPEQQHFVKFILDMGGIAGVARSLDDWQKILDSYLAKLQSR